MPATSAWRRSALAVVLAGVWINASEFLRNQVLLNDDWEEHYRSLGLTFPVDLVNGLVWGVWGFVLGGVVFALSRRFALPATTAIAWATGFVMMWLVIWNLDVLPAAILVYAVPLSLLESFVAALICAKVAPR